MWDLVDDILTAAGHPPVKLAIPRKMAWLVGALLEFAYKIFRIRGEPQMTRFLANELATAHWFDIRAARKDLGLFQRFPSMKGSVASNSGFRTDTECPTGKGVYRQ